MRPSTPRIARTLLQVGVMATVLSLSAPVKALVRVWVVAQDDQVPAGAPAAINYLYAPFTDGNGTVGFLGRTTDGDYFIWYDTGITWLNSDAVSYTLTGGETYRIGVSNTGGFVYNPNADSQDAIWTHNGLLIRRGDQAPGLPADQPITYNYRPMMLPNGRVYWIAAVDDQGGTTTRLRVLYTSQDASPLDIDVVLHNDDVIDGYTIKRSSGIDYDYDISDNGEHHIHVLLMDTGTTTNDKFVYVDGALVAHETEPTGQTDNWDNFDIVSINNQGNYLFSGDTDGSTTRDEFLAYNGEIQLREGDVVDYVTLGGTVYAASINNLGQAAFIWYRNGGGDALFFAADASDLASAFVVLQKDDQVDVDGDSLPDASVYDFEASNSSPGVHLAEDGYIYVEVELDYGMGNKEAIIRLRAAACGNTTLEFGEECDLGGETATCDYDCTFQACGDGTINSTAGEDCDEFGVESTTCDDDCTEVVCGDGTVNTTAGEECDDEGESADCNDDCTLAVCGDQKVNATAGEECDEGRITIDCDFDCTVAECGDATVNELAGEVCDEGGETASCNADCTLATCGDQVVNATAGEECDTGVATPTCNGNCTLASCGDGVINGLNGEACDDAGESETCNADCTPAACGDGKVNTAAGEDCDEGIMTVVCDLDCTAAICGDGELNPAAGEECDDGNTRSDDGCSSSCKFDDDTSSFGCDCSAPGPVGGDSAALLLLVLLGLAWRQRRWRL